MAGIIKREFHVFAAESFVDEINSEGDDENNVYMGIGRDIDWISAPGVDTALDTEVAMQDFWTNVEALAIINPSDVSLVVPRKDWVSGIVLKVFDTSILSSLAYAENFYVRNNNGEVYTVVSAGASSLVQPTGTSDIADDGNGNSFKYMYTIKPSESDKFLTDGWMPVEFEDTYTPGDSLGNHLAMGAKYAMVYGKIDDPIPTNFTYRQVSILRNVLLNDNADDALKSNATALTYVDFTDLSDGTEATKVVRDSGEMMYMDNRGPVNRDPEQKEEIRLILEF